MQSYIKEIEGNYKSFSKNWRGDSQRISKLLGQSDAQYLESYKSIVSLQAWRVCLLEAEISKGSLEFFLEAQNDALVSHILASQGIWRCALQSLRSLIENVGFCIYYMDHPVELALWIQGRHKPSFTFIIHYFQSHPKLDGVEEKVMGVSLLNSEWHILSRAVHASAKSFRMTASGHIPSVFSSARAAMGSWNTRESRCIYGANLLLMCMFSDKLEGARLPNLRKAISLVVGSNMHTAVKKQLGIRLYKTGDE